ncbi:MAG TPA: acyltransferase [Ktedonobacterales bacterium]
MRRERTASAAEAVVAVADAPTRADSRPASPRLGYVDGLRALAALYVLASHCVTEVWPYNVVPGGAASALSTPLSYGHYAVSVFIVLSGFSLMLPVARNGNRLPHGAWGFYWRRARRILPPYYFAMALSLLLIWAWIGQPTGTHWDVSLPVTGQSIVEHVLLVQDFSRLNHATINHAFWSIALECQIYLFFPLLILAWRRYSPTFVTLGVMSLSFALLLLLDMTWVGQLPGYSSYTVAPQYLGLFAMGMWAASAYTAQPPLWRRLRAWYVGEAVALICGALLAININTAPIYTLDFLTGAGTVGLLIAASRPGRLNPVRAALGWRPLVWMGGFAYSIYLIHAPLVQLLWQYGLHPLRLGDLATYLALVVVGLPLIVMASWLFWYVCERPFLNSKPAARTERSAWRSAARWLALRFGREPVEAGAASE